MKKKILEVTNLHAAVNDNKIVKGLNLVVHAGEIHAIMGKNGSGKSTFAKIIAGHPDYTITNGDIRYQHKSILELTPEDRAKRGIFLSFQYPIEIPGVTNADFLRLACNARRIYQGLPEMEPLEFFEYINSKLPLVDLKPSFLTRDVNEGFSGGEKKRNEILQMSILDTKLAVLDETDSGLDIDALRTVANGINSLANDGNAIILITHYQRLLDYIKPDFVHVMQEGKIIKTGSASLALDLEKYGYDWLKNEVE